MKEPGVSFIALMVAHLKKNRFLMSLKVRQGKPSGGGLKIEWNGNFSFYSHPLNESRNLSFLMNQLHKDQVTSSNGNNLQEFC